MPLRLAFIVALVSFPLVGCGLKLPDRQQAPPGSLTDSLAAPVEFPDLKPGRMIEPGVRFQEATLQRGGVPMRVWLYTPNPMPAKVPLVLVPPAGSTCFIGMETGEGARPEQIPYVKAGFAVATFDIDGNVPNLKSASDSEIARGAREFRAAGAGIANAKAALDFVLAKVPNVDPDRIFIAGHSSAGTLALLFAEHEPRIKACAAYAPVSDVETRLAPLVGQLESWQSGYGGFLRASSPKSHAEKLQCPLALFHAENDTIVPISQSREFAALVKKTNPKVTLWVVPTGGHYDSMIQRGIPKGIELFREESKSAR